MSLSTSALGYDKLNATTHSANKNTSIKAFNLDPYLLPKALEERTSTNTELINLLAMTTYNQIALNAIALGNEPGLLNTSNLTPNQTTNAAAAANNPNQFLQKVYGSPKAILDQAKAIAQKISTLYEGGQVTGDFDGQGLSVGYLQWNIGSGTLQPLLKEMSKQNPQEFREIFGAQGDVLKSVLNKSKSEQLSWAKSINQGDRIIEPWKSAFNKLTKNDKFIEIENEHSKSYQATATNIMNDLGVKTVRGYALAFDIAVQNGSIKSKALSMVNNAISGQTNKLTNPNDPSLTKNQRSIIIDLNNRIKNVTDQGLRKLYYTAAAVAISSKDQFAKDVWNRKSAIIAGEGKVHGSILALDQNMGLNDQALV